MIEVFRNYLQTSFFHLVFGQINPRDFLYVEQSLYLLSTCVIDAIVTQRYRLQTSHLDYPVKQLPKTYFSESLLLEHKLHCL
jgi:hypothetical protein